MRAQTPLGTAVSLARMPSDVWKRLCARGYEYADASIAWRMYREHFNRRTVVEAIELARIAREQQPITLRGCFYRAVSAGLYPTTADKHYRQAGSIIVKLRRAGLLDYRFIVDSTRRRLKPSSWSGLADFAETVAQAYRKDLWSRQKDYLEVFVEKDAMAAVIEPVTAEYDVHLNIIRGSCSESFVWAIAEQWARIEKPIYAYYLGDCDPAGQTIERDLRNRLAGMVDRPFVSEVDFEGDYTDDLYYDQEPVYWERLAITDEDFARKDLLGFPVKGVRNLAWRSRNRAYLDHYGDRCVEVDALAASEVRKRIRRAIEQHIEPTEWERLKAMEGVERQSVLKICASTQLA